MFPKMYGEHFVQGFPMFCSVLFWVGNISRPLNNYLLTTLMVLDAENDGLRKGKIP